MNQPGTIARAAVARFRERSARRHASRSVRALFVLYGLLLLWVWLAIYAIGTSPSPNGSVFGVDFSHIYAAVRVLSHGHNPYDYHRDCERTPCLSANVRSTHTARSSIQLLSLLSRGLPIPILSRVAKEWATLTGRGGSHGRDTGTLRHRKARER
jgi:hypothetical protein